MLSHSTYMSINKPKSDYDDIPNSILLYFFLHHPEYLLRLSSHYKTKEPLSLEDAHYLKEDYEFGVGISMMRKNITTVFEHVIYHPDFIKILRTKNTTLIHQLYQQLKATYLPDIKCENIIPISWNSFIKNSGETQKYLYGEIYGSEIARNKNIIPFFSITWKDNVSALLKKVGIDTKLYETEDNIFTFCET